MWYCLFLWRKWTIRRHAAYWPSRYTLRFESTLLPRLLPLLLRYERRKAEYSRHSCLYRASNVASQAWDIGHAKRGKWSQADKLRWVHNKTKEVAKMQKAEGCKVTGVVETNQIWLVLQCLSVNAGEWNRIGKDHSIKIDGLRLVFHHQISDNASTVGKNIWWCLTICMYLKKTECNVCTTIHTSTTNEAKLVKCANFN